MSVWFISPLRHSGWFLSPLRNFKVSDTPPRGPEGISGHPATAGPPNNKEIA